MRNDAAATVGRVDMRIWFGFRRLPFSQEVKADEMFLRPCMEEVCDRVAFAAQQGLMFAVIGDVGAGKSTALRYTFSRLPKKQYSVLQMTGGSWSFTELLRSCSNSMNVYTRTSQQTMMLKQIADGYASIRESGATPLLFIDEAHLFQQDVFRQLHLLAQPFCVCQYKNGENDSLDFHSLTGIQEFMFCSKNKQAFLQNDRVFSIV